MTDKLAESLERLGRTMAERASAEIIQLPLWQEAKRGTPNSFLRSALFSAIQSKDREFLKSVTLASQDGITVKFTGEQLNQEDLTLWETLVHLAKKHPLGNICTFTAHGILKALNLPTGGKQHKVLHEGIIRLIACAVEITHEGKTYAGSLVVESGSNKDEITSHYSLSLNRTLIRLYGETQWTAIDWKQRLELRRKPLAQALHGYYSSHRAPYPVKLETLHRLMGSRNAQVAGFRRHCRTALDELVSIDFLTSYSIDRDIVTVKRVAAAALPSGG
jgi:hypothetical protein